MGKRPPLLLGLLPFGLLGVLLGLGDFARLARYPVERLAELRRFPPYPRSVLWIDGIHGAYQGVNDAERLLIGLSLVALLGIFLALAATLSPRFQLLKRAEENPGSGLSAHVDVSGAILTGAAILFSLWLIGALEPVGLLMTGGKPGRLTTIMGGLPAWTSGNLAGQLLLSLTLGVVLWWIWGPRGPLFPADAPTGRDVLVTGLLMGGAALPGVIGLYAARNWLYAAESAFSVADAAGWRWLFGLCLAIPVVSLVYLGALIRLFRPQPLRTELMTGLGLVALAAIGVAVLEDNQGRGALRRLDAGAPSLAARLKLPPPQMQRYALILAPFGGLAPAIAEDGVSESPQDSIRSTGAARDAVGLYLDRTHYRTTLAFRAFGFLDGCAGLDWESTKSLGLRLAMAEAAPSPLVMRLLVDRLVNCPITPENRRVLDRLADPSVFVWPQADGAQRLGAAYLRFGDPERARKYLLSAQLDETQRRQLLGGVSPLSDGVVRGKITVEGKPLDYIRVGLINERDWQAMAGIQRPYSWAAVLDARMTDKEGRFEFRNLPQGRYVLVVTGARIGTTHRWTVSAHPGVIQVDRFRPLVTLPAMDFRSNGPTVMPPGTDPGTTA